MSKTKVAEPQHNTLERKYSQQLKVIQEANQLIASGETTENILLSILHHLLDTLGYCAAQIYQLSPFDEDVWLYLELGPGSKPVTQNPDMFSIEEKNIISDAVRKGEPIYIPNVLEGPYSYYGQGETDTVIGSELAIPFQHGQKFLGVLRVQRDEPNSFDEVDTSFLCSLANLIGPTIKNNRTIQQLENDLQEIKMIYSLQHEEDLTQPQQAAGTGAISGYQYDQNLITNTDQLSKSAELAITERQTGIATIQEDDCKELVAPIQLYGETIGVLGIENIIDGEEWTTDDISLLEEVSSQVALAIQNSRLLQQTREQTKELSILFEANRQLSETIDLNQIYEILTTQTVNYLNADRCSALLLNRARTHFELIVEKARANSGQLITHTELRIEAIEDFPSLQQMLKRPEVIIQNLDDPNLDPNTRKYLKQEQGHEVYTLTRFPLVVRNRLVGIMVVEHLHRRHEYTENELQLAQAIISQVDVAIENAQLFQQTQTALSETQRLYEISRTLVESTSLDDIFDTVLQNVTTYDVDRVSISLLDRSQSGKIESVTIAATWDRDPDRVLPVGTKFSADNFSLVQAFAKPPFHPLISLDLHQVEEQDERMDEAFRAFAIKELGAVTLFSAPMFLGTEYKGVLSIYTRRPHVYSEQEIRVYQTLADQAIIAIENRRLLEATQRERDRAALLSTLGQQLLTANTPEAIYNLALSAISPTEPTRGAAIFIYDQLEGGVELEMVDIWNYPGQEWPAVSPGVRFSTEDLGLGPLLKTGQTVVSNEATEEDRFSATLRQLLTLMQIDVLVAVPLWINQEVNGFVLIGNQGKNFFSTDIIRLYEDIARETSGALENRRLFDEAEYRAKQLQIAAEISQAATSYLDLDTLLSQSVDLIRDRFGYSHVSTFLVDEYQRYAVVQASTGEVGQKMLAMKHKLEVGGKSIVGAATGTGKPRIALDVGKDAVHFNNPLLPDTRSEMALPLIAQRRVIGALDVQSTKRSAFSESDITILQSMANQLANAIQAARSFQESREALEEVSKLHQHYLRDQWGSFLKEQDIVAGYQLTEDGLVARDEHEEIWHPDMNKAVEAKQPVIIPNPSAPAANGKEAEVEHVPPGKDDGDQTDAADATSDIQNVPTLVAPLTLDGQAVIGTVDFEIPENEIDTIWDDETLSIIEAVTSQAAQSIEAIRLFEQTQAAREEAEALYEVGRTLVATESEQKMFSTVLGEMLSTLGLKQGGILFFEDDRKFGNLYALFEEGEPVDQELRIPIEGNLSYQELIKTKRPVVIEDVATDPLVATVREINVSRGIVSLLLVPIIINDEVIGAMGADSVGRQHIFTERELNLAIAMADQLSIMLQNRRLIEETRRRAVLLQTSSDVGRVASSILDQDMMLDEAVKLISERFGFHHVQIFLIDKAKQFAVLYKSTGEAGEKLLAMNHKVAIGGQSVIGQVTDQRKPLVIRGTDTSDPNILQHRNEFLPDTQAELAIPLQVGETLVGALDVQSTLPNAFTDEEISTLETLSAQLAIAIQNARAFQEQQETADRLKEIDKLKTQFLANMSHELRTPLNSIIGFSRVILKGIDGPLTDLQKADLTSIHNSGQHLLGLINNVLDIAKIEAGKMELNFEEVEVEPIIKTVISTAIALVKDKAVTLHQEVPEVLPTIWADPTRIRQIVLNLVSNASKFTNEGSVTIRVFADDEKVTFSVTDTGIGILQEQMTSVFEEFTQVDASTTRKVGGTGLGLPISRHFVEMHKGKIWVESTPGRGSTFSFYIPIQPPGEDETEPSDYALTEDEREQDNRKLVVAIDDDPGVITLYERFLEKQNYEVVGIHHSRNVVSRIKEYNPFAILLDVIIPEKDGWSVLKELKDDPLTKDIPVIICSIVSDKNRGFSLGATNYLTKPIVENELVEALQRIEDRQKEETKVLVVDDQADDILLIRRILEVQSNYRIFEASNGIEGLELVKSREPDLIILDLNMPEMNGFAMLEELKKNEKMRTIPIIIVSAQELTPEEHQRLTGQVEVLLHKGIFTENELLEDVGQALERLSREEKEFI